MKRLTQTRIQPFGRTAARLLTGMALAIAGVLACVAAWPAGAGNPNALWQVVHDLCVVDLKASGSPAPCSKVDLARGIAVLKDIRGATQLLLIPTQRVSGVEDPQLLEPQSPNYWQAAWEARDLLAQRAGKPLRRDEIGLAINSIYGRTQNQLHIHIDCIAPDVQRTLQADESKIGPHWAVLSDELAAHHYRVMRLDGADLGSRDPFKLVAEDDPAARADMGRETLVVVGAVFADGTPGFVLLSHRANPVFDDLGHGESLLDHSCQVLAQPGRPQSAAPNNAK